MTTQPNQDPNIIDLREVIRAALGNKKVLLSSVLSFLLAAAALGLWITPAYQVGFFIKIGRFDRDRDLEKTEMFSNTIKAKYNMRPMGLRALTTPQIVTIEPFGEEGILKVLVAGSDAQQTWTRAKQYADEITGLHAEKHAIALQAAKQQVALVENTYRTYIRSSKTQNDSDDRSEMAKLVELGLANNMIDLPIRYLHAYQNLAEIESSPTRVLTIDRLPTEAIRPNWKLLLVIALAVGVTMGALINLWRSE